MLKAVRSFLLIFIAVKCMSLAEYMDIAEPTSYAFPKGESNEIETSASLIPMSILTVNDSGVSPTSLKVKHTPESSHSTTFQAEYGHIVTITNTAFLTLTTTKEVMHFITNTEVVTSTIIERMNATLTVTSFIPEEKSQNKLTINTENMASPLMSGKLPKPFQVPKTTTAFLENTLVNKLIRDNGNPTVTKTVKVPSLVTVSGPTVTKILTTKETVIFTVTSTNVMLSKTDRTPVVEQIQYPEKTDNDEKADIAIPSSQMTTAFSSLCDVTVSNDYVETIVL